MKSPQRPLLAADHRALRRRGRGRRRRPHAPPRPATPRTSSRSTTTRSRPCSTWRRPSPTAPPSSTPTWAPTRTPPGCSTPARRAPAASVDEAIAAAEADPDSVVVRRRFRQQRLIPAFMEPRSCVVDPTGEQLTIYAATQIPHILRTMTTVTLGVPESKLRVIAPDVGGGFGGKIGVLPEEMLCVARRAGSSASRSSGPRPARSRCWPPTTAATRSRTSRSRPRRTARSPASTSTCSPTWAPTSASSARACRSSARSCSTRSTRSRR